MNENSYKVIMTISRHRISFEYWLREGKDIASMPGGEWPEPLSFYVLPTDVIIGKNAQYAANQKIDNSFNHYFSLLGNNDITYRYGNQSRKINNLLLDAAESIFDRFYKEILFNKYGSVIDNRATMPLFIVCEPDLKEHECAFLYNLFKESGYVKTCLCYVNDYVGEYVRKNYDNKNLVGVWTSGNSLCVSLFGKENINELFEGLGIDPRLNYVKEIIWDQFVNNNPFLDKDKAMNDIDEVASEFLNSGKALFQSEIRLYDGQYYHFTLCKNEIDGMHIKESELLRQKFDSLLHRHGLQECTDILLILRGVAAKNSYFKDNLGKKFSKIISVDESERKQIIKLINTRDKPTSTISCPPNVPPISVKRTVRLRLGEIKGMMRAGKYDEAQQIAINLKENLNSQGYNNWNSEIKSILDEILIEKTRGANPPKPIDANKFARKIKEKIAEAKAKARLGNKELAIEILDSQKKELHSIGVRDFDMQIDECIESINNGLTIKPSEPKPKLSEGQKMIIEGKFAEAKSFFAREENSAMVKVCNEFIKSKRIIDIYSRAKGNAVASALKDLSSVLELYKEYKLDTTTVVDLINKYKKSKQ